MQTRRTLFRTLIELGYGPIYANAIGYGGKENDDALPGRAWMLEKYSFLDPARMGIVGWS